MKKILIFINIILIIISCNVYAYEWTNSEIILRKESLDLLKGEIIGRYYSLNGETYSLENTYSHYSLPTKQSLNFMMLVDAGDEYMYRYQGLDVSGAADSYNKPKEPIRFYDKEFNEIGEYTFPYDISAIGYFDGYYYAQPFTDKFTYKSSDKENWVEVQESVPVQTEKVTFVDDKVSFDGHNTIDITYEDNTSKEFLNKLGEYVLKTDEEQNYYLSNDNVYFVKINKPIEDFIDLSNYEPYGNIREKSSFVNIYPYEDDIVITLYRGGKHLIRLYTPKTPILNDLEQQKLSPYVMYNNKILGFEVAPVIVNDRTLIPVRFLFEQMGANVEWNNDTQTATISTDDKEINITINSQTATVNGQTKTLDTPAQLINGKTMIPVRFISEELGYTVNWDGEYRIITIE